MNKKYAYLDTWLSQKNIKKQNSVPAKYMNYQLPPATSPALTLEYEDQFT